MGNAAKYVKYAMAANMRGGSANGGNMYMGYAGMNMYGNMGSTHGNRSAERERMPRYNDGRYEDRNQGDERVRRNMSSRMNGNMRSEGRMEQHYGPYSDDDMESDMNRIGFRAGGDEMEYNYRADAGYYPRSEMGSNPGHMQGKGMASSKGGKLTREIAEKWVKGMRNEDGTKGPHFSMEQVKRVAEQRGGNVDLMRQWVAMNAMYSDYCAVLRKYGVNMIDAYYDMAEAFINDEDAGVADKLATYYECIVRQ